LLSQTAFAQGQSGLPDEAKATFIVTDMYTGPDGLTHLRNKEIKLRELEKASATVIGRNMVDPARPSDWHNAPWRRYVVPLSGRFEVEVSSDGTIKSFGPGDILLAEDTTGKGHKTRAVGGDCVWLFVELDDPTAPGTSTVAADAQNPFVGIWELNLAKSKFDPGPPVRAGEEQDNNGGTGWRWSEVVY
jgi:hypothetical protein